MSCHSVFLAKGSDSRTRIAKIDFAFRTVLRAGREAPNANGYFVQNGHGATVAGPFATPREAWAEEDRLRAVAARGAGAGP